MSKATISERFKKTREDAGYTQQQMADRLGIERNTVKQIDAGNIKPNLEIIRAWKKCFKVSYDWIIDGKK